MKSKDNTDFETQLERLEEICEFLRSPDTKLAEASKYFEEGIVLSQKLEKELAEIEAKVERLMKNQPTTAKETVPDTNTTERTEPYLELFNKATTLQNDDV